MSTKKALSQSDKDNQKRLKQLWAKHHQGLTQADAAEIMGYETQGAVSHYINGRTALSLAAVLKFSSLLNVPPEDIAPNFDYGYRPNSPISHKLKSPIGTLSAQKLGKEIQQYSEAGILNDNQINKLSALVKAFINQ